MKFNQRFSSSKRGIAQQSCSYLRSKLESFCAAKPEKKLGA